ncbi:MAG: glucosyltransferase domain-containing protein [Halomonas sp.]|uniref:glucosyltransferase domain-containing protein n=1 Tax=Halomonas sp. TaxID=1486246 RepID=UPI003F8DD111
MLDTTPLPQLLAIGLMALPLFATSLFIGNMAFRFDALSMSLAVLSGVLAAGALWSPRPYLGIGISAGWLLVTLMLYQPAVNVFVALCCLHAPRVWGGWVAI